FDHELGAHGAAQAVGADQRDAIHGAPVLEGDPHAVLRRVETRDAGAALHDDARHRRAGVDEHAMNVLAMDDDVGMDKAAAKILSGRDVRDLGARERVEHQDVRRDRRFAHHGRRDAEAIEHGKDIRPELDAVADWRELLRLLEHAHRKTLAAERERGREAAEPAAGDQDRSPLPAHRGASAYVRDVGASTGPPVAFQAPKPPATWATGFRPMRCTVWAASAERRPPAQKKTKRLSSAKTGL